MIYVTVSLPVKDSSTRWHIKSGPFHFVAYNVYSLPHIPKISITYQQYLKH